MEIISNVTVFERTIQTHISSVTSSQFSKYVLSTSAISVELTQARGTVTIETETPNLRAHDISHVNVLDIPLSSAEVAGLRCRPSHHVVGLKCTEQSSTAQNLNLIL